MTTGNKTAMRLSQTQVALRLLGLKSKPFRRWIELLPKDRIDRSGVPPKIALALLIVHILETQRSIVPETVRAAAKELFEICETHSYAELAESKLFFNSVEPRFRLGGLDESPHEEQETTIVLRKVLRDFFEIRDGDGSMFDRDQNGRVTPMKKARRTASG